jgi:cellulose 1,4-beta-cellobiosidase
MGNRTFYGRGMTVDTSQKMTVVTQFIGNPLREIKRFYVQNGRLIPNSQSNIAGVTGNSITTTFCDQAKAAFGDVDPFKAHGGMASMSRAMAGGMTLVMSIWDDHYANMLWLDSTYPIDKTGPGGPRGSCSTSSGNPQDVEANSPGASVTFSNIKFGPINSTYTAT